jgi:hypothetical protein
MNIIITSFNKPEYLLIESKGELSNKEDLVKHSEMIYEEVRKYGAKKALIDEPGTRLPVSLFSYYEAVEFYLNGLPPDIRSLKIAVVIAKEYKEMAGFWETVCVNRGLQYFAFTSFQDAHDWLVK